MNITICDVVVTPAQKTIIRQIDAGEPITKTRGTTYTINSLKKKGILLESGEFSEKGRVILELLDDIDSGKRKLDKKILGSAEEEAYLYFIKNWCSNPPTYHYKPKNIRVICERQRS